GVRCGRRSGTALGRHVAIDGGIISQSASYFVIDRRAFILSAGMFAVGTDAFVIAGILPETAQSLSTSIEQASLVVSIFAVAYAVGSPLLVAFSEGWKR